MPYEAVLVPPGGVPPAAVFDALVARVRSNGYAVEVDGSRGFFTAASVLDPPNRVIHTRGRLREGTRFDVQVYDGGAFEVRAVGDAVNGDRIREPVAGEYHTFVRDLRALAAAIRPR